MKADCRRIRGPTTDRLVNHLVPILLLSVVLVACAESPDSGGSIERMPANLVSAQPTADADPLVLAQMLVTLQRDLFARLADPQQDPSPLLSRGFRLIDRSDSLSWQQFSSSRPFARTDSYIAILASRLPPDEVHSDRFEVWRHPDGSVLIVSHLEGGRFNMTEWSYGDGSWKAGAMILNPPEGTLELIAANLSPILAGS